MVEWNVRKTDSNTLIRQATMEEILDEKDSQ